MVWPFKKKEVIDLTYLAKRGTVKTAAPDYKDLSKSSPPAADSGLGFLGSMASSAEPSGASKNKLEDIEYKLDIVSKRVNAMLDRLDLVEKKLDRDLRQASV